MDQPPHLPRSPASSKRVSAFARELIKLIPRVPNDAQSLEHMTKLSMTELLIAHANWKLRHVRPSPREVLNLDALRHDARTTLHQHGIDALLDAVRRGVDLSPHLSLKALRKGYAPGAYGPTPSIDSQTDKDLVLYAIGVHHFHLGANRINSLQGRTDELLFAFVSRDAFEILGLFDHSVFKSKSNGNLSPEQSRLWQMIYARQSRHLEPGSAYFTGLGGLGITTAGTAGLGSLSAIKHAQIIRSEDPKLDDRSYVRSLYIDVPQPSRPKFEWHYNGMDLCLLDRKARYLVIFNKGET